MTGLHVVALVFGFALVWAFVATTTREMWHTPAEESFGLVTLAFFANLLPAIVVGGPLIWWGSYGVLS